MPPRPPLPELDLSRLEPGTVIWYRRRRYIVATSELIRGGPFEGDLRVRAVLAPAQSVAPGPAPKAPRVR